MCTEDRRGEERGGPVRVPVSMTSRTRESIMSSERFMPFFPFVSCRTCQAIKNAKGAHGARTRMVIETAMRMSASAAPPSHDCRWC